MTNRGLFGIIVVALGQGLAGCGGPSSSSAPTAPTAATPQLPSPPQAAPVPAGTFFYGPNYTLTDVTLSGVVFEVTSTGPSPVEGVEVYCDACGPTGHTSVKTDGAGSYSFRGMWLSPSYSTPLIVRKDGYVVAGSTNVMVTGDTRFDIPLVRR